MSWPEPAWFGSCVPAAAKAGNEVNERVVLGHFPLISTQLKSSWALTSGIVHSSIPEPPGVERRWAGDNHVGHIE